MEMEELENQRIHWGRLRRMPKHFACIYLSIQNFSDITLPSTLKTRLEEKNSHSSFWRIYLHHSLPPLSTFIHNKHDPAAIPEENEDYSHLILGRAVQEVRAEPSTAHPEHLTLLCPKLCLCSQNRQELEDQWERGRSQLGTLWGAAWEPLNSLCCHGLTFTALSYGKKQMRQQIEQFGSVSAIKQKSWISLTRAIAFLLLPSPALKDHRQAEIYKIQQLQ